MPFLSVLTTDPGLRGSVAAGIGGPHHVVRVGSWARLLTSIRERPVTGVVVDSELLPGPPGTFGALRDLADRFRSVWVVLLTRPGTDPRSLLQLGRAGIRTLVPTPLDAMPAGLRAGLRRGFGQATEALVTRKVSSYLPAAGVRVLRLAMVGAELGWDAERFSLEVGFTRQHLSVRLRGHGLPSAGHLLGWARLLHAGRWLADPGRTGESVSRQLEYSSGAAFRRALKNYVDVTPMQVRADGGLTVVLDAFLDECGLRQPARVDRSVA